ncbi:hypothetical protein [Algoriphagus sp. CAU 1675]|uniref:hypothetical protein n=1 Tax=Algoriphagus sp. CAU 1675 TaxID=3032597 RepID=UPI0023DB9FFC|nr:hypothetical protein [Algoriphagus sp. CAU 1675]MDF2157086.1 hypothetical protein [Algoriphagus sp. CAU 1675]
MLFFTVNGQLAGTKFNVNGKKAKLEISAKALSPEGELPVEIVFNGKVIQSGTSMNETIILEDSGCLAVRTNGAHSNPVFVNFKGRPAGMSEPAERFIEITEQLEEWVNTKGLFYSEEQKQEVLKVLEEGKNVYRGVIETAKKFGR